MPERVYLDWNATAPLRPEARDAVVGALDVLGNPSSVHGEGRAAKGLVERARAQVAALVSCDASEVIFTSGSTEAVALAFAQDWDVAACSPVEHDAILQQPCVEVVDRDFHNGGTPTVGRDGVFRGDFVSGFGLAAAPLKRGDRGFPRESRGLFALTAASSETGVVQPTADVFREFVGEFDISRRFCDATQIVGKMPWSMAAARCDYACLSAHKLGGPKGIGALVIRRGLDVVSQIKGGGQEMGRRSGTENIPGIAGFGAAAVAAARDLDAGAWERVAELRTFLETSLEGEDGPTILVGKESRRLPNTSCLITPGWKGETQVMALDLAGFAVSAGSACSSGKVRESAVLRAMGYGAGEADCAIRVSLGPSVTMEQVERFVETFLRLRNRRRS
ncbi:MAG: aminotransferase class V-fold PLP-dependent enzyme [Pseudomonadota bacterium]